MNTFFAVYADELLRAVQEHHDEYSWPESEVPGVVELMKRAVINGNFSKDGLAFKATCKRLGIKHTYKAIRHFIANHD